MFKKNVSIIFLFTFLFSCGITQNSVENNMDDSTRKTFSIVYSDNSSDIGSVISDSLKYESGKSAIIQENKGGLSRTGFLFTGWNTKKDGTGLSYSVNDSITIQDSDIELFAEWISLDDISSPLIKDLKIDTLQIDTSFSDRTVSFTIELSKTGDLESRLFIKLISPSGNITLSHHFDYSFANGNNENAYYESKVTIPQYSEPGNWTIVEIATLGNDPVGSPRFSIKSSFFKYFKYDTIIKNNSTVYDKSAPEITSISIDNSIFTIGVKDDRKIKFLNIGFRDTTQKYAVIYCNDFQKFSGSESAGVFIIPVDFSNFSSSLNLKLFYIAIGDSVGNIRSYYKDDLIAAGYTDAIEKILK
ncbi:MAG: hypothetical protein A2015_11100 [Spirochaetes bacterium GWF1_31_7]|nr:MAG: hypothetical protein A2Y30_02335 [Spirochaetes bacterium GWE1_32_154]OHD46371.1 MAG: hypothetical protein A2Y29_04195 [Spirochaetes bacterium GWE2_31_10]OHD47750.1 MAG: hypothetical protein A2015_11100 [Spirochaetes bacterium GWF1_31_7]OHD81324.1 MAG: hypothetical protein A2355_10865 [Spirochaetes bacterium RIFOXYB1_FULL_32_8]